MSRSPEISAFGLRLRVIREAKRLSQKEFGELGAASEASQAAYEKGKTPPSIEYLYKLAEHGVNIAHLLTGQGRDAVPINVDFLSEVAREVEAAYKDANWQIGAVMLVQSAGTIYCDLTEIYETIDECRSGLKIAIRQLRRDLASPGDPFPTQSQSQS